MSTVDINGLRVTIRIFYFLYIKINGSAPISAKPFFSLARQHSIFIRETVSALKEVPSVFSLTRPMKFHVLPSQLCRSGPHVPSQTYTPVLTAFASSIFLLLRRHRGCTVLFFYSSQYYLLFDLRSFPYRTN